MSDFGDKQLLALIERAYDATVDPSLWRLFIEDFAGLYRGGALLFAQDLRNGDTAIGVFTEVAPAAMDSYATHYSARKPWLDMMDRLRAGAVMTERELIERSLYERSEYFNDWLKPQGFSHLLGNILKKDGGLSTTLTAVRSAAQGEFDSTEQAFCGRLTPHLQRAVEMQRQLATVQLQRDAALAATAELSVAILLVDRSARILFANDSADRVLRNGSSLLSSGGRLSCARSDQSDALARLVADAVATAAGVGEAIGGVLRLERPDGPPLSVLVCPMRAFPGAALFHHASPAALILIGEPSAGFEIPAGALAKLYDLTFAEARLLAALLGGETLAGYADARGISLNTVKTQLQHLFDKTGQSRQSDLLRHVLGNPVVRMAGRHGQVRS